MNRRDVIAQHLAQGLTVRQIAAILGVTTQAVYKTIRRYDLRNQQERAS